MIDGIPDNLETPGPIVRPAGALGGGALSPKLGRRRSFSRENLSLTQRRQPASDAMREGSCSTPNPSASARTNT